MPDRAGRKPLLQIVKTVPRGIVMQGTTVLRIKKRERGNRGEVRLQKPRPNMNEDWMR